MSTAKETILRSTAFAYGYRQVVATELNDWNLLESVRKMAIELKIDGCFQADGNLKEPYRQEQINGAFAAAEFIENRKSGKHNYTTDYWRDK